MPTKRRNRPDKDGKDKSKFEYFKKIIRATCSTCAICGLPINYELKNPHPWSFTVDHIVPIAKGGQTSEENLQPAHWKCNRQKGERVIVPLEEVNKLRRLQGAAPILKETPTNIDIEPGNMPLLGSQEYLFYKQYNTNPNRDLPQSANWRVF